jgi:hypothetical protein
MLNIAFDVSVLVINKADIIYQAFNASSENEIPPLFGNVDLLMDLLCVSEADSTFKAYYAGFMRWKKLLRMVLTCWIYSQEICFMLHLFIFFNTNKSIRK